MGTPFANEVVGGGGALVIPRIQSPNFSIAGQTGWAIMADGSAYFFNVTAEGSVTSNTVIVEGSGNGIFVYNGVPAAGNLILSIASAAGADSFGNPYSGPGMSLSNFGGSANEIQLRPDLNAILIYAP